MLNKKILTEEEVQEMNASFDIENIEVMPEDEVQSFGVPDNKFLISDSLNGMNKNRSKKVKSIKVPLNDIELDGDELSQERMARAITTLNAKESTIWIDAAGEPQELTKEDLKKALKLAGQKQTEIFIEYAQKKAELLAA